MASDSRDSLSREEEPYPESWWSRSAWAMVGAPTATSSAPAAPSGSCTEKSLGTSPRENEANLPADRTGAYSARIRSGVCW